MSVNDMALRDSCKSAISFYRASTVYIGFVLTLILLLNFIAIVTR